MMGVLTYFLGFQIKQSEKGISINQEKYVKDLLKKYDMNSSSMKTPMVSPNNFRPDLSGKVVNETQYRGMIRSLMYLTASRPDIQFSTCLCARYQANPKEPYLIGTSSLDMSSAKAEYVAVIGCCANILWMKSQLTDYDIIYEKRSYSKGDFELHFILTQYQLADIFTKPLDEPTFKRLIIELDQIEFTFEEIAFTTNNEVALLYPSHLNSKYFREVSDFNSKWCLKEAFIRVPTQYKEYLSEFWYTTKTLDDSKIWVSTLTKGIRGDIGYSREIGAKGTLKRSCLPPRWSLLMGQVIQCLDNDKLKWEDIIQKLSKKTRENVVPYPRFISLLLEYMMPEYNNEELTINPTQVFSVHNRALKPNQTKGPPMGFLSLLLEYIMPEYDNEELTINPTQAICNFDVPVDSKAPKPSSQTKEVPQSKKPRAKSGLRRKQSLKHTSKSKTEASKSKTGQLEKETRSCSAKDKSPSHLSPSTPVVSEMHKEAHRAVGGPTSLGATSKEGAHPQLSSDSTAEADPGLSAPNDSIPSQQDESEEEEEVAKDKDTHASSHDNDELKQQKAKVEAKVASLKARPSYPDVNQLTTLLVTSLKPELSKLLASHNFASCLPTELKELPSKFTELSREIKELKQHVKDMEIELPGDLKDIPTKLETFYSTIFSLTSQKQLKTLDSLPSLLNTVTETLNRFTTVVENASEATTNDVPLAGQATASPAEGEKNTTKDAETNL
ncbi:hypothetical protein Tco_1077067 [Tanacetum coccineum]